MISVVVSLLRGMYGLLNGRGPADPYMQQNSTARLLMTVVVAIQSYYKMLDIYFLPLYMSYVMRLLELMKNTV